MKITNKAALLACVATLTACGAPSAEKIAAVSFSEAETNQPVQLFSEACLKTLPNFDGFLKVVEKRGLTGSVKRGENTAYIAPGEKFMTATVFQEDGKAACAVAFLGANNSEEVGGLFLDAASRRTGGAPKDRFPSGRFNYAYQLKNGSVMVYEAKEKSGQFRHIVLISKPVPREEVAAYIYD
ncbi:hypothetical protein [Ruegeria faecimaris]|uniref:hypothetical protein n=1 Tax=Ruegeria faecimaris TaxID=686389 RepID=UPI00232DD9D8|nr:hypothetical protein [Ruegeria faecimaris]